MSATKETSRVELAVVLGGGVKSASVEASGEHAASAVALLHSFIEAFGHSESKPRVVVASGAGPCEAAPAFSNGVIGAALLAGQADRPEVVAPLQDNAHSILGPASLAGVVERLCKSWSNGPCLLWRDIDAIDEDLGADLEQRVAFAIRALFFEFSNLLRQGSVILLELEKCSVDREQAALEVENFLSQLRKSGTGCVEIADFQCRLRSASPR